MEEKLEATGVLSQEYGSSIVNDALQALAKSFYLQLSLTYVTSVDCLSGPRAS